MDLVGDSGERSGADDGSCDGVASDADGEMLRFCKWTHLSTADIPVFLLCFPSERSGLGDNVRWLFHSLLLDRLDDAEWDGPVKP